MPSNASGTLVIIPARMQATRLPGKPLADIHGKPMIVHVWQRAQEAACGRVVVATDSDEIAAAVRTAGGEAVMTRADHINGTDRTFEAVNRIDPDGNSEFVVNLQGDLPTLEPHLVRACLDSLIDAPADIATLAAEITDEHEKTTPSVVKVVGTPLGTKSEHRLRALYFTRATAPSGDGPLYHHIGLYAYRRAALERFVALPPSVLEQRERLEQLRPLAAGLAMGVAVVDEPPARGRTPFGLILVLGAVAIVAVIVGAAATGTVDDLPWGAIIGVAVVMAFAYAAARRRRIPPDDDA